MESTHTAYQASARYPPIVQSHIQTITPLPITRKKVLPLEEITNNYNITPKVEYNNDQARDFSSAANRVQRLHARRRKHNAGKVASSHSFPWEDLVAYHQYRQKQRRENVPESDSVWDEEAENAFMDGLRKVPRLGRRKLTVEGKPCGRNELIAAYIYKRTGKHRTRKQVSSHIQVLKNLLKNNAEFMTLVSAEDGSSQWEMNAEDIHSLSDPRGGRMSTSTTGSQSSGSPSYEAVNGSYDGNYIQTDIYNMRQNQIKPINFTMWVASTNENNEPLECLHRYARLSPENHDNVFSPIILTHLQNWESRFPYLAALHEQGPIISPIIHIGAPLETMDTLPSQPSTFCTQMEVNMRRDLYLGYSFECVTRVYGSTVKVSKIRSPLNVQTMSDESQQLLLPFASEFWAAFFTRLVIAQDQQEQKLRASGTVDNGTIARVRDQHAKSTIMGLTIIQELLATPPPSPDGQPQKPIRVALFLWEFSKTENNEGLAVWRDVVMPHSSTPSTTVSVPRLRFDPIPEYSNPSTIQTTPIDTTWGPQYYNYTSQVDDSQKLASNHLQYIPSVALAQNNNAIAIQPRGYELSNLETQNNTGLNELHLHYLQGYPQYPAYSFSSNPESTDYQWQSFPVLNSQEPSTEGLQNILQ